MFIKTKSSAAVCKMFKLRLADPPPSDGRRMRQLQVSSLWRHFDQQPRVDEAHSFAQLPERGSTHPQLVQDLWKDPQLHEFTGQAHVGSLWSVVCHHHNCYYCLITILLLFYNGFNMATLMSWFPVLSLNLLFLLDRLFFIYINIFC